MSDEPLRCASGQEVTNRREPEPPTEGYLGSDEALPLALGIALDRHPELATEHVRPRTHLRTLSRPSCFVEQTDCVFRRVLDHCRHLPIPPLHLCEEAGGSANVLESKKTGEAVPMLSRESGPVDDPVDGITRRCLELLRDPPFKCVGFLVWD